MKNGCCVMLSILVLLLSFIQICDAVKCVVSATADEKECPACAAYSCGSEETGCPEDFYRDCSSQTYVVELIRGKNPNEMEYYDEKVSYVSGCSNEIKGTKCIIEKLKTTTKDIVTLAQQGKYHRGDVYWHTPSGSSLDSGSKGPQQAPNNPNSPEYQPSNKSNGKNGALKFIGIISIGWILFAACF